jgi:hypothetical protein
MRYSHECLISRPDPDAFLFALDHGQADAVDGQRVADGRRLGEGDADGQDWVFPFFKEP